MTCSHKKRHIANVDVNNIEDTDRFMIDVRVWCADCGMPFRFIGLPDNIINTTKPFMPYGGEEACLPIEPMDMDKPLTPERLAALQAKMPKLG